MQVYHILFTVALAFIASIMANVDGPTPYQSTCSLSGNRTCSSENLCRCEETPNGERVCTQQMACDYAATCDTNNDCEKDGSTCVIEHRCDNRRLCYSTVIFSPELCPPLSGGSGGVDKK